MLINQSLNCPALSFTVMAACLYLPSTLAYSQALEEVIVTAEKREQSLQDVPISIIALGQEALQLQGIDELKDRNATRLLLELKDLHVVELVEERGGVKIQAAVEPAGLETAFEGVDGFRINR